jgi:hypothetical protein
MRRLLIVVLFFSMGKVFAQELKFGLPERLNDSINSASEDINPLLSRNGKKLYLTRSFSPENEGGIIAGSDIWVSELDQAGNWTKATNQLGRLNNKNNNAVIGLSENGETLFLLNSYKPRKNGIAFSKWNGDSWSAPEVVSIPGIYSGDFVGYFMNAQFNVLLISMNGEGSYGQEDLYVSVRDSLYNWSKPMNLGPTINTSGFEISPFLSDDGKRLYFSSDGRPGLGGADIFVSERLYDSWATWSIPKNMGPNVNSPSFDAYFSLSKDSIGMFSSNRSGKSADVYLVRRLKEKKEVVVTTEREFLSNRETYELLGLDPLLGFASGETSLTEEHKRVLKSINTAIEKKKDVKCAILALKSEDRGNLEVFQKRLLAVLDHLKSLGMEGNRVSLGIEADKEGTGEKEYVKIKLYR